MTQKRVTVEELMTTPVISLKASDTVERLREEMAAAEIRHMPIVDDQARLIGIVSQRDLNAAPSGSPTIADIMKRQVLTVKIGTPASAAAILLIEHKISALPVLGNNDQLVGVITATDFLVVAAAALSKGELNDHARA